MGAPIIYAKTRPVAPAKRERHAERLDRRCHVGRPRGIIFWLIVSEGAGYTTKRDVSPLNADSADSELGDHLSDVLAPHHRQEGVEGVVEALPQVLSRWLSGWDDLEGDRPWGARRRRTGVTGTRSR
jgi:hypothetical protein